jgi:hypothetical protein
MWRDPGAYERRILLILLAAGFFLRLISTLRVQVIATDGVRFLGVAEAFARLDIQAALANDYHPLYPALIALLSPLTGGLENAAFAAPLLLSTLTILPLFGFFRIVFGRPPAFIAASVFTFLPPLVRPGADTISEGVFHFFIVLCLYLGASAFRDKKIALAPLAGLCAGCSYLVRPEGLGILGAFGIFTALLIVAGWGFGGRLRAAGAGLLVLTGFLAPAAPYLIHIRMETGSWELSLKKRKSDFQSTFVDKVESEGVAKRPGERFYTIPQALGELGRRTMANFYYIPALFALLGIFLPWGAGGPRPWRWEVLLWAAVFLWAAACFFLLRKFGYLSHRHPLPITLFMLGYVGRGAWLASGFTARTLARVHWSPEKTATVGRATALTLIAITALTGLRENLRAYRWDKVHEKRIGAEIAGWEDIGETTLGDMSRVAYYGGGRHVRIPFDSGPRSLLELAVHEKARLLVFNDSHLSEWAPRLREALTGDAPPPPGFTLVKKWTVEGRRQHEIYAFRLAPTTRSSPP